MRLCRIFPFLFVLLASGCAALEVKELTIGDSVFRTEIAKSPEERQRGLMGRKSLGDDEAMLFVFEKDQKLSFWMKNTPLPLSIAFIDSRGVITEIRHMEPYSERTVRSRYSVRYALEVNRGVFREKGVEVGDRIEGLE